MHFEVQIESFQIDIKGRLHANAFGTQHMADTAPAGAWPPGVLQRDSSRRRRSSFRLRLSMIEAAKAWRSIGIGNLTGPGSAPDHLCLEIQPDQVEKI